MKKKQDMQDATGNINEREVTGTVVFSLLLVAVIWLIVAQVTREPANTAVLGDSADPVVNEQKLAEKNRAGSMN